MMKRCGVSLTVCFALMIWGAVAHAESGKVTVTGEDSCGQFIAAVGDARPGRYREMNSAKGTFTSENRAYQEWLSGFVSGFNLTHLDQQVRGIDPAGMDLWMRNWCNKNPTKTVFEAASTFIAEMLSDAAARR